MVVEGARLLNRGEEFRITVDGTGYVGECVWSWEEVPGRDLPRPVYPVTIMVQSIDYEDPKAARPVPDEQKRVVAAAAARALKAGDPGGTYLTDIE